MSLVRVRFMKRAVYDTNGPGKGPVYEAGSVHELRADEAERWFRRGLAEPAPAEAKKAPAAGPAAEPAEPPRATPAQPRTPQPRPAAAPRS